MVDFGGEGDRRWLERILWWECEEEVEGSHLRSHVRGEGWRQRMVKRTLYGDPVGPSIVTFHCRRFASSASATDTPAGADVMSSPSSCLRQRDPDECVW